MGPLLSLLQAFLAFCLYSCLSLCLPARVSCACACAAVPRPLPPRRNIHHRINLALPATLTLIRYFNAHPYLHQTTSHSPPSRLHPQTRPSLSFSPFPRPITTSPNHHHFSSLLLLSILIKISRHSLTSHSFTFCRFCLNTPSRRQTKSSTPLAGGSADPTSLGPFHLDSTREPSRPAICSPRNRISPAFLFARPTSFPSLCWPFKEHYATR